MLDGEWINRIFASSDEEFNHRLDEALKSLDLANATKRDFCGAVVDVLCDDVSDLCLALKEVCDGSGYSAYYESHISHDRFVRLVLSVDTVKLGKMKKILEDAKLSPIDVLRGVGAVLNDETLEERTALGAKERQRANAELRNIAEATMKAIDAVGEKIDSVGAKVDAVAAKIRRGRRRGKYTEAQIDFCGKAWDSACDIQEIRNSTNTKVSYEAAFQFFHRQLAKLGVESVDEFKSIIRAHQARELRRRRREKSAAQTRPKNGIMSAVNRTTKSMVIGAAVILSGMAAPLRSDASARISITPPTQSRVAHNFTDRITSTVSQGSDPRASRHVQGGCGGRRDGPSQHHHGAHKNLVAFSVMGGGEDLVQLRTV